MRTKEFTNILEELGWPHIFLVSYEQYAKIDGDKGRRFPKKSKQGVQLWGVASDFAPVITVLSTATGKRRRNVLYHEVAHHLWPNKPHWWIEAFAEKMARGGGRGDYCKAYGYTVDDLPPRERLVVLARRAAKRFNERQHGRKMD